MRRSRLLTSRAVYVLCILAVLTAGVATAKKTTKTITGVVKGAEVYKGKVVAVYIADLQEGDVVVFRGTRIGKELLEHVGATVTATGYVKKAHRDPGYELGIDILSYEVVPAVESDD